MSATSSETKIALINARVFDGRRLSEPRTVVIDGTVIGTDPADARTVDAGGAALLPGLIDSHIHLHGRETLDQLLGYGVTTGLDMGTWPPELLASLRGLPGSADVRSAGIPAIGPDGPHSHIPGRPDDAVVRDPDQARRYVTARISEGSDYIKIVLEAPGEGGLTQETASALVGAAHAEGKRVVAHAVSAGAYTMALDVGADVITHVPLGPPLDTVQVARIAADGRVVVPTLTMMEGITAAIGQAEAFAGPLRSVTLLHQAGVPVLAGTDANARPGVPFHPPHGESLHHELELLVSAGLSPAEALRAATALPARHFGLTDRGTIAPGLRADLILIDGDPVADIRATRNIVRVWCGGTEHGPARP
ncbi:amidohydrolase family protein [Streptosporangium subroseum]|uniref:amidohydrolase family protein n=1 Tax=Streptosporangium subroseum TaxID=106412 RepID=UPI00352DEEF1